MTAIFDFDGTLADSFPVIQKIINMIRKEEKLEPLHSEDFNIIKTTVGMSTLQFIQQLIGVNIKENIENYIAKAQIYLPKLFPGVEDFLKSLKTDGIKLILATNKNQKAIDGICEKLNITQYFDEIRGTGYKWPSKPNPEMITASTKKIFIGDTKTDYQTALNDNCQFVGVSFGIEDRSRLGDLVVDNFCQLQEEIQKYLK